MNPIPIYRDKSQSGGKEHFYVPSFRIIIENEDLTKDVTYDVMQVSYKDSVTELDSFELVINNWDAGKRMFKYEGEASSNYKGIFDPGKRLELQMGYLNNMRPMLIGEITTLEPNFPESGGSTLSVRGQNFLYSLRKKQHTKGWYEEKPSNIAKEIIEQPVTEKNPGLGLTSSIHDEVLSKDKEPFIFMNNQYDIVFLMELARRYGYTVSFDFTPQDDGKAGEPRIFFGPSEGLRDITYELEWGKSLVHFRPTLTTSNQISQVTVRGWDRGKGEPVEGTAKLGDKDISINRDQHAVALAVQGRHEVIHEPVYNKKEAEEKAKRILLGQTKKMVQSSGATVGLPDLRAGRKVQIKGLSERYNGEYFVTETNHVIGDNGYRTTFSARREELRQTK